MVELDMKFIVDHNVGKLVKRLRMMGCDTLFFTGEDDWQMVITALREDRTILTRDSRVMKMGVIASGRAKAVFIESDNPEEQLRQVAEIFGLPGTETEFLTICLECNRRLEERTKEEVKDRVPPYVYSTQDRYMECPSCHKIYWKGTHWQAMSEELKRVRNMSSRERGE
jgi:hypothetical protein